MMVSAVSGIFMFAIQPLTFAASATLTSWEIPMLDPQTEAPTYNMWATIPTDEYLGYEVGAKGIATSLAIARVAAADDYHAEWRVTFTTDSYTPTGAPFAFWYAPELHRVDFEYAIEQVAGSGSYVDLGLIRSIDIDLPEQLDSARATIEVYLGGYDDKVFVTQNYRHRLVDISLGYVLSDATTTLTQQLVGHINNVTPLERNEDGSLLASVSVLGRLGRLADIEIDETWKPADGQTLAARALYVAQKCGYTSAHISTTNLPAYTITVGTPECMTWDPSVGQNVLEHLKEIAQMGGCVPTETGAGVISFWVHDYFDAVSAATFDVDASVDDPIHLIEQISNPLDYDRFCTAVMVTGQTPGGYPIWVSGVDLDAERVPASANFCGYRKTKRISGQQFTDLAGALTLAANEYEKNGIPYALPAWRTRGNEGLDRRNRVTIEGTNVGLAGTVGEVGILAIHMKWSADEASVTTEFSGRVI